MLAVGSAAQYAAAHFLNELVFFVVLFVVVIKRPGVFCPLTEIYLLSNCCVFFMNYRIFYSLLLKRAKMHIFNSEIPKKYGKQSPRTDSRWRSVCYSDTRPSD